MICEVYLFGNFGSYFQHYPQNSETRDFFQRCSGASKDDVLGIHRAGHIVYYAYIRKMPGNAYFGIGIALNAVYISDVHELLNFFYEEYDRLVMDGKLLTISANAAIEPLHKTWTGYTSKLERAVTGIRHSFASKQFAAQPLPPRGFGIKGTEHTLSTTAPNDTIVSAGLDHDYCYVTFTASPNNVMKALSQLQKEKEELSENVKVLEKENQKLQKEKKQIWVVAILICVLLGLSIGAIAWINSLNDNVLQLNHQNGLLTDTIRYKTATIDFLNAECATKDSVITELEAEKRRQGNTIREQQDTIRGKKSLIADKNIEIARLNATIRQKDNAIREKDAQIRRLGNNNSKSYEIYAQSGVYAYYYEYNGSIFEKTPRNDRDGTRVVVYHTQGDYVLTAKGWLRRKDIR